MVFITTKRGSLYNPTISVDTRFGINTRAVPEYDIITDPGEYLEAQWRTMRDTKWASSPEEGGGDLAAAALYASQEVLGELEQTLNASIEEKAKSDTVALQPELDPTQEMTVTELNGWDYIGYLSIPSIGLELPVMSQWSYAGLKIAPGRYSGSTYADNMVVCAHNYAKHFSPIKWLTEGAQVYFTDMDGMRWTYEVSYVENLQPTQIEEMTEKTEESDEWDLTLFTCTTGGSARCAVRCVRTGYPALTTETAE